MPADVAKAAIDRLIQAAEPGEALTLAFMGGEPLVNRKTLHASTRYAAGEAAARGIGIGFSITTNATLLREEDIALFQEYGFTLTISLDGLDATHDRLRPYRSGNGSFATVAKNVSALLAVDQRRYRVLARVTVTPKNLDLPEIMTGLLEMGFDAIMFSPMLSAPSGKDEMLAADLDRLLDQLIRCGESFREGLRQGRILPFSNVITTLQRIHFVSSGNSIPAVLEADTWAYRRTVDCMPAIASSMTRMAIWAMYSAAWTGTSSPIGSIAATSRSNLPVAVAGHATFAPEAATTRRSSADALPATTFGGG